VKRAELIETLRHQPDAQAREARKSLIGPRLRVGLALTAFRKVVIKAAEFGFIDACLVNEPGRPTGAGAFTTELPKISHAGINRVAGPPDASVDLTGQNGNS
jgi:hypothetical protein